DCFRQCRLAQKRGRRIARPDARRCHFEARRSNPCPPQHARLWRLAGGDTMTTHAYDRETTGPLVIDPYNDFISEGGKIWDRIRSVAEANSCVPHMLQVLTAARAAKLRVFYALHRRYRPGDYEGWTYIAPVQRGAWKRKTFE